MDNYEQKEIIMEQLNRTKTLQL